MPLESCMIVIDNSEYTRNGDYTPTRFQAQAQAVASVFTAKTDSNPESSVGLLTMAGKSPSLLVTPTNDIGKLLSALSRAQIGGTADLTTAVQIAQLALKHRENKNAQQRVVVFAGSHIGEAEEELVKLGKKLRKNNVFIDVCLFGEEGMEEEDKVGRLIEAAGGGESHLVTIPPGPHLLSDIIQTSPILYDGSRPAHGEEGGEGMDADGLDPNLDPELAMAIRMSLQDAAEAAARANAANAAASSSSAPAPASAGSSSSAIAAPSSSEQPTTNAATLPHSMTAPLSNANVPEPVAPGDAASGSIAPAPSASTSAAIAAAGPDTGAQATAEAGGEDEEDMDEDEMLRRAMALSQEQSGDVDMSPSADDEDEDEDEDAAVARAIAMSLEEAKEDKK